MKIVRYLDSREQVKYAAQQADGTALEIQGDILGDFKVGGQRADVKKLLAPLVPAAPGSAMRSNTAMGSIV